MLRYLERGKSFLMLLSDFFQNKTAVVYSVGVGVFLCMRVGGFLIRPIYFKSENNSEKVFHEGIDNSVIRKI